MDSHDLSKKFIIHGNFYNNNNKKFTIKNLKFWKKKKKKKINITIMYLFIFLIKHWRLNKKKKLILNLFLFKCFSHFILYNNDLIFINKDVINIINYLL